MPAVQDGREHVQQCGPVTGNWYIISMSMQQQWLKQQWLENACQMEHSLCDKAFQRTRPAACGSIPSSFFLTFSPLVLHLNPPGSMTTCEPNHSDRQPSD